MAAGATHAPAIARAISFLFIRISFVEGEAVVAIERFLEGPRGEHQARFMEHPPNSYREATRMMPKPRGFLKGFFANRATNRGGCCASATGGSVPGKDPEELFSRVFRRHEGAAD